MTVKTYRPQDVSIVFAGPVTGYADGTFVSVDFNEDSFSLQMGTDGDGCRSQTNNGSAKVTLTLGQWSATNDVFSALHLLDKLSGDGILPFLMKDGSGRTHYAAETAWLLKPPTVEFGREAGSRVWVIESDKMVEFVGGQS